MYYDTGTWKIGGYAFQKEDKSGQQMSNNKQANMPLVRRVSMGHVSRQPVAVDERRWRSLNDNSEQ